MALRALVLSLSLAVTACSTPLPGPHPEVGGGGGHPLFPGDSGPFAEGGGCGFGGPNPVGGGSGSGGGGGLETAAPIVPATPPPPISGGTLTVWPDGTVVVADPDRDLVALVDLDGKVRRVPLQPGDEPGRVAIGPTGRAFVALRRAAAVVELDLVTGTIAARHAVCPAPRGLAWSPRRQTLAVACASGVLTELKFVNGAVAATATSRPADDLRDVYDVDGDLYLSTFRDAHVLRRSVEGEVRALPAPGLAELGQTFVPHVAWRMVPTSTGALMVHQRAQTSALPPSFCTNAYGGGFGNIPGILHTVVSRLSADGVEEVAMLRGAVLPVDLAVSADEASIAIATPGAGVWIRRGAAAAFVPVMVRADRSAEITAVGWRGDTAIAFDRRLAQLWFIGKDGTLGAPLALEAVHLEVRSTGHELFHQPTASSIACASCHPEGGEDGNVWRLAEGPRRTPSLRGGLKGTEPFHWSGDLPSMGALMNEVLVNRMGGRAQSAARVDALISWLDVQPKLPAAPVLDAAAVSRGKALFDTPAIGCVGCHAGPLGTNNANSTVGTGLSLQVPRLTELKYRAPYFHDGRVPSLAARFTDVGGGDLHGHVSELTAAQVLDLVAYLETR